MRTLLALLVLSIAPQAASAAPLTIALPELVASNVATFDPSTFSAGPNIDVYHLSMFNPNAGSVTGLLLDPSFLIDFLNFNTGSILNYKLGADLPTLGPNTVAESFFVIPEGWEVDLPPIFIFPPPPTEMRAPIGQSLPVGWHTIAVISVLPGSSIPDTTNFIGQARVNGVLQDIIFVPEPSTAILLVFGMANFAMRRPVGIRMI